MPTKTGYYNAEERNLRSQKMLECEGFLCAALDALNGTKINRTSHLYLEIKAPIKMAMRRVASEVLRLDRDLNKSATKSRELLPTATMPLLPEASATDAAGANPPVGGDPWDKEASNPTDSKAGASNSWAETSCE